MTKIISFIFYFFVLALQAHESTHFGLAMTSTGQVQKWKSLPIAICIDSSVPTQFHKGIQDSLQQWNSSFSQKLFKTDCSKKNKIHWVKEGFHQYTSKTSLAQTVRSYNEDTGEILQANIFINAEYFDWNKKNLDLKTIMIHELGHMLALKHNFISLDSVMNYYPYQSGFIMHQLGDYELKTIRHYYFQEKEKIPNYLHLFLNNDFEKALSILKNQKNHLYAKGYLYKKLKKYSQAIEAFEKILKKEPQNQMALQALADTLWSMNNTNQAILKFKKLLEINPNNYEALASLGAIYNGKNLNSIAQPYLVKAVDINPTHYLACFYLAKMTREQKYFECVKRISPDPQLVQLLENNEFKKCIWCIENDLKLQKEVRRVSQLPPSKILQFIKDKNICIKVMASGRKIPPKIFSWGQFVKPQAELSTLTKLKGLMGKTLCKDEHKVSEGCMTIVLADDAPKSTLFHEYLHTQQIKKDPSWCQLSKKMWKTKKASREEIREVHNREWDVIKFLWKNRKNMKLDLQDHLAIASEIQGMAKKRSQYDPSAQAFVQKENVQGILLKLINDYRNFLK